MGRAGLSEALQVLMEHDLAARNGTCWLVEDPVFRCWLSTILLAQQMETHRDEESIRRRLDGYLDFIWRQHLTRAQLSFAEQITELFSHFCDDTVSLDSKTGRLPHFEQIQALPQPSNTGTYLLADGEGKRWCVAIKEGCLDEQAVSQFDAFCKTQQPKPSRKLVVTDSTVSDAAKVAAKTANMWVWETHELKLLDVLYRSS